MNTYTVTIERVVQAKTPLEACEEAHRHIMNRQHHVKQHQSRKVFTVFPTAGTIIRGGKL